MVTECQDEHPHDHPKEIEWKVHMLSDLVIPRIDQNQRFYFQIKIAVFDDHSSIIEKDQAQ